MERSAPLSFGARLVQPVYPCGPAIRSRAVCASIDDSVRLDA